MLECLGEDEPRGSALESQSRLVADLLGPQLLLEVEVLLGLQSVESGLIEECVSSCIEVLNCDIITNVAIDIVLNIDVYEVGVVVIKAGVRICQVAILGVVDSSDNGLENRIIGHYKIILY